MSVSSKIQRCRSVVVAKTIALRPFRKSFRVLGFQVFTFFGVRGGISELGSPDGSTWVHIGLKMGQHSLKMGPT